MDPGDAGRGGVFDRVRALDQRPISIVAPVLLDVAFDTSVRDLRVNWIPIACLVLAAVGITTIAVAWTAHAMIPGMSWAAAIALGAIVAPPDAAAASAVLRRLNLPHRLLVILEGESLLNDASALLIYRIAVLAVLSGGLELTTVVPMSLLSIVGSAFGTWILAEHLNECARCAISLRLPEGVIHERSYRRMRAWIRPHTLRV